MRLTVEDIQSESKESFNKVRDFLNSLPHIIELGKNSTEKLNPTIIADHLLFLNMQTEKCFALARKSGYINISVVMPDKSVSWTGIGGTEQQLKYLNALAMQGELLDGTLLSNFYKTLEANKVKKNLL